MACGFSQEEVYATNDNGNRGTHENTRVNGRVATLCKRKNAATVPKVRFMCSSTCTTHSI